MSNSYNQHGIRAVPSEGTRSTAYALKADNYTTWSCRMKAVFIVNNVWGIVEGTKTLPPPPPVLRLATSTAGGNEILVDETNKQILDFQAGENRAVVLLAESISDSILLSVTSILSDPAATWKKLQQKFARKSELEHEASQKAFLSFQHEETESADETITRFEAIVDRARQQGVSMTT